MENDLSQKTVFENSLSQPQSESEMTRVSGKKSWIFIGSTILVLFLVGTIGYLAYQNQQLKKQIITKELNLSVSPTLTTSLSSDWEVYSNERYGFSIKYPQEGALFEIGESSGLEAEQWQAVGIRLDSLEIQILAYENKNDLSSREYAERESPKISLSNEKTTVVGGKLAYQYDYVDDIGNEQFPIRTTTVVNNNHAIVIIGIDKSRQADFSDYDSVLSTFEFIRNKQIDGTENWKTYKNEDMDFELMHPENYLVMEERNASVSFGFRASPDSKPEIYLTASSNLTDYANIKSCSKSVSTDSNRFPCLDEGKNWDQDDDISEIKLGSTAAKSFYIIQAVPDMRYHIVQIANGNSPIEFKMFVAGGGLDQTFITILSTVKFL